MPVVVAVLGVVVIIMGAVFFLSPEPEVAPPAPAPVAEEANRTEQMETEEEMSAAGTLPASMPEGEVNTLTLSEDVKYLTPARTEHKLAVTLVVENGVVADASIVYDEKDGYSNDHQKRFDAAYKTEVIGKALGDISLSRVGGASLTSTAFNEAVAKIAAQS